MSDQTADDRNDVLDVAALARDAALPAPGELKAPPTMKLVVVTCMDARIRPHALLGLDVGTMHVLRNAAGRVTDDTMRSLLLSTWALGTRQIAVIHHSSCGGAATDDALAAAMTAQGATGPFPPLHGAEDQVAALREDVERIRSDRSLPEGIVVTGHRYDLDTGRLVPLSELEAS